MSTTPDQPLPRPYTISVPPAENVHMAAQRWKVLGTVVGLAVTMKDLLSRPNRGPSRRRKKALLIGINYDNTPETPLRYPRRDTKEMRQLLQETFDFFDEEIITLTDEVGGPLRPTRHNIMLEVSRFISRGQNNTDYVLFYSGHSGQHPELPSEKPAEPREEDGYKEFIVPLDAMNENEEYLADSVIYDTYLHEQIIKPLEQTKGCHLFAVFDSCHSATLLNLFHHRCNRVGTFTSSVRRFVRHFIVEDVTYISRKLFRNKPTPPEPEAPNLQTKTGKCHGFCPRIINSSRNSTMVICISGSKDDEVVLEHETIDTLTTAIVNLLKGKPDATLKDAIYTARDAVDKVHKAAKVAMELLLRMPAPPPQSTEETTYVELARWHPQLSSNVPLDTNLSLMYTRVPTEDLDRIGRVRRPKWDGLRHFNPVKAIMSYRFSPPRPSSRPIGNGNAS